MARYRAADPKSEYRRHELHEYAQKDEDADEALEVDFEVLHTLHRSRTERDREFGKEGHESTWGTVRANKSQEEWQGSAYKISVLGNFEITSSGQVF